MDKTKNYIPQPADTSHIELPAELTALAERIAENVHDVWAKSRMAEGWTYGPERNDDLKQTPCMVPYSELPETEKEYDRATALQTIKFIKALGFNISRQKPDRSQ